MSYRRPRGESSRINPNMSLRSRFADQPGSGTVKVTVGSNSLDRYVPITSGPTTTGRADGGGAVADGLVGTLPDWPARSDDPARTAIPTSATAARPAAAR